jgi:hypothetical protein
VLNGFIVTITTDMSSTPEPFSWRIHSMSFAAASTKRWRILTYSSNSGKRWRNLSVESLTAELESAWRTQLPPLLVSKECNAYPGSRRVFLDKDSRDCAGSLWFGKTPG